MNGPLYFSTFQSSQTTAEFHNQATRQHPLSILREMRKVAPEENWVLLFWAEIPGDEVVAANGYFESCADDNEGELP